MNQIAIFSLMGPAIGPTLGGFVVQNLSWRLVFFINVPLGLLGALLVALCLPYEKGRDVGRFDYVGGMLFGSAIALLLYAFQIITEGMKVDVKGAIFVASFVCFWLYIKHYRRQAHPMLDWHFFRDPIFKTSMYGMVLSRLGTSAMPFLIPLLYQLSLGYDPFKSGLMLFPMTIGSFLMLFAIKPILRNFGYRKTLIVNSSALTVVMILFAFVQADMHWLILAGLLLLYGVLFTLQASSLNTLTYSCIQGKPGDSSGSSIISSIQQISSSFGITVSAVVMHYLSHKERLEGTYIPVEFFHITFVVVSLFVLFSAIMFLKLPFQAGEDAAGAKLR
jgi:predicted MFS family arabinose efflux permease